MDFPRTGGVFLHSTPIRVVSVKDNPERCSNVSPSVDLSHSGLTSEGSNRE